MPFRFPTGVFNPLRLPPLALQLRFVSRFLNKRNTALAPDYITWSAGIGYALRDVEMRLDAVNINNQRPPVSESELGDAQYYLLPARSIFASMRWTLGS